MSAFILVLLKIVTVAAGGAFLVCVLIIMACLVSQLFRGGSGTESWDFMLRVRRIAFRVWLVALIAGLSMAIVAVVSGQG